MKASEMKRGSAIQVEGRTILIKELQVQTASSRSGNTLYKVRGTDVVAKQKFEKAFKGDEVVQTVELERRPVQLLYRDSDGATFMDSQNYDQFTLAEAVLADELPYMPDGIEGLLALYADGELLGIELPAIVVLEIVETAPGMKGSSASARSKPATLTTGLVVQVPEYLETGERIRVNTMTGEFSARA